MEGKQNNMYYEEKKYYSRWRKERDAERKDTLGIIAIVIVFLIYSWFVIAN